MTSNRADTNFRTISHPTRREIVAAVGNWRLSWRWRYRRRSRGLENYRAHSAPKPCWLRSASRCFEGILPKPLDLPGQAWGVLRYRTANGQRLNKDFCTFNGWYPSHVLVQAIYADWCIRYPDHTVVLVTQDLARFMKRPSTVQVPSVEQRSLAPVSTLCPVLVASSNSNILMV